MTHCQVLTFFNFSAAGLKSRFDLINFDDFDEDELKTIWKGEMEKRKFECDDRVTSVVARRLARQAGRKGFGNARAVRKEVVALFIQPQFLQYYRATSQYWMRSSNY